MKDYIFVDSYQIVPKPALQGGAKISKSVSQNLTAIFGLDLMKLGMKAPFVSLYSGLKFVSPFVDANAAPGILCGHQFGLGPLLFGEGSNYSCSFP